MGKVAAQKDILDEQLQNDEEENLPDALWKDINAELKFIKKRRGV